MHGVGVFDYASVPGAIRTQVYMCPFAPCTTEMMETGDCLTYIQAVAIEVSDNESDKHTVVLRSNALRVDGVDRKKESSIPLGADKFIKATGIVSATAELPRSNHMSLADCHTPSRIVKADSSVALTSKGKWKNCTIVEWTLTTPEMTIDIGVIGPFEKGFLREEVSDRTFNLGISDIRDVDAVQGVINGDKNGFFTLDDKYNYKPAPNGVPGALVPVPHRHGQAPEVTGPNVAPEDMIFAESTIAEMDAECGTQQALSAVKMGRDTLLAYGMTDREERDDSAWIHNFGP